MGTRRQGIGSASLLALAFFGLYLMFARQALHGYDAYAAVRAVQGSPVMESGHLFYVPLAKLAWAVLSPIVPGAFEALRVLSAVGVAIGVFFAHRCAVALRLERPAAAAIAFGLVPSAFYFASTVEVDGLLLGAAGGAWLLWIRLARGRRAGQALAAGLATALVACLHGGGHLLFAAGCTLFSARALQRMRRQGTWRPLQRHGVLLVLAFGAHATAFVAASLLCGNSHQAVMAGNSLLLSLQPDRLSATLLSEWLVPYAPFSLLWLLGFARRSTRWLAAAFAVVLVGYLVFTNAVMGWFEPRGPELHENGAFLVGICLPMVLQAHAALRPWLASLATVAAAAVAIVLVRHADWEPVPPGFSAGLRAVAAEPAELWADMMRREAGWVMKDAGRAEPVAVSTFPGLVRSLEGAGAAVTGQVVAAWFDERFETLRADGRSLLILHGAMARLRELDPRLRALVDEHLPRHYVLEPVVTPPFPAVRVRRR
jgi:hypothetical protein